MTRSIVILAIPAVLFTVGCGAPVDVVVPDGFTGEARIVYDPENGLQPQTEGLHWVYRVPSSGELRVRYQAPFFAYHTENVRHEGGKKALVTRRLTVAGNR